MVVYTSRVVKMKDITYHFVENSAYLIFNIELLFTILCNFGRDAALKDSAFWWVTCLIHKVLWYAYSLIIFLTGLACHVVWYILYWWWRLVELGTDEVHDKDCVEERFYLAWVKFERDGERGWEALGMGNCNINIWDGSELELAWSRKNSSYFENDFPIFLWTVILNNLIFKVRNVLHWVNFLVMKTFSNIFRSTLYWCR